MMEDLYTGKVTIRQLRRSLALDGGTEIRQVYEELKGFGGPGMFRDKNYLILPSNVFCNNLLGKYAALFSPEEQFMFRQVLEHYCSRYVLTMLIVD